MWKWGFTFGGSGGDFEPFQKRKVISIGYGGDVDLRKFKNEDDLIKGMNRYFRGDTPKEKASYIREILIFKKQIEYGDMIVAYGHKNLWAIGKVSGDYDYLSDKEILSDDYSGWRGVRKVKWLKIFEGGYPSEKLSPELRYRLIHPPFTFLEVVEPDLRKEIFELAGLPLQPIRRRYTKNKIEIEESEDHKRIKRLLEKNPGILEKGMKHIFTEYRFITEDAADLLLRDGEGRYATVEVKAKVSKNQIAGLLQAIKYKHMFAVEQDKKFKEIRTFLISKQIAEDVKKLCRKYGVECKEIHT